MVLPLEISFDLMLLQGVDKDLKGFSGSLEDLVRFDDSSKD